MSARISIAPVRDDDPGAGEGARLLVDRLWPRGIKKEALHLDEWVRDVAPGTELRRWFGHDPQKWEAFRTRYRAELDDNPQAVERCLAWCRKGRVTLLFDAHDHEHNQAVVLRDYLAERLKG
ncbi:DUF488 family protein [Paracoccus sp. S-4012]|uniref:DUF488 domain-containing protein n=1 Tax=Paracoccus sp. S-4012 TaxID=2665648 RepID=UPI0012AF81A6|nr:DUF488 family protein [Paracoccus sp. S-4012]MRX49986.1 DUF488 family protein [Paracoccus sp. S-4012]